ncbi:MAG: SMC-Scp complex subunit ScpB, partial [Nitrospirota bacterium]
MEDKEIKAVVETLLFLSDEPLSAGKMAEVFDGVGPEKIKIALEQLKKEYDERNGGIQIVEIAEGYRMITKPEYSDWIKRFYHLKVSSRLSKAALETLAIIAYKQPIVRAEMEAIRGVNVDGVLKTLIERRLIKVLGRKNIPGRPLMYGTTREFLQYFGLKDLSELPTPKEFTPLENPTIY